MNLSSDSGFYFVSPGDNIFFEKTDSLGNAGCEDYIPVLYSFNDSITPVNYNLPFQHFTVTDSDYVATSTPDTFYIQSQIACTMGLMEHNKSSLPLQLYPNPSSGLFTFKAGNPSEGDFYIITDVLGKTIINQPCTNQAEQVDLSGFAKGIYIIKLYQKQNTQTGKVVVQ